MPGQRDESFVGFAGYPDGHADGVMVRMTCYTGDYSGSLEASSEIEEVVWLSYADRERVAPVDQIIFDDLRAAGRLA